MKIVRTSQPVMQDYPFAHFETGAIVQSANGDLYLKVGESAAFGLSVSCYGLNLVGKFRLYLGSVTISN